MISQSGVHLTGNTHQSALAPISWRTVNFNASATANCCGVTGGGESWSPEHCFQINNYANSGM